MGESKVVLQKRTRAGFNLGRTTGFYFMLAIFFGLFSSVTTLANADDNFLSDCVAGLETTGGRGSNAAGAYCGCMAKASAQFNGDSSGMLAVMQAPIDDKTVIFRAQNDINKNIISSCVTRVEEVFGVAGDLAVEKAGGETSQPQGIWADSEVIAAIQAINMKPSQAKVFKASATKFSNDLRAASEKILRESLDINRKIKKKRRVLSKRMDKEVIAILDRDQIAQYRAFSSLLAEKISNLGRDNQVDQNRCLAMGMGKCG